tara:strand:- start:171513 stop:172325 length:813 start_codon:yes stop_codon:yes gene_type:complete
MKNVFNKIDSTVIDKKFNFYKITVENQYTDAIPGGALPVGYSKVPSQFQLKRAVLDNKGKLVTGYGRTSYEAPNALYEVDDECKTFVLTCLAKKIQFLTQATKDNANIPSNTPVVGTRILDTGSNYAVVTSIDRAQTNGRVDLVTAEKVLSRYGKPFQKKVAARSQYYSRYHMIDKSHLTVAINEARSTIRLLNQCFENNIACDAQTATANAALLNHANNPWSIDKGEVTPLTNIGDHTIHDALLKSFTEGITRDVDKKVIEELRKAVIN